MRLPISRIRKYNPIYHMGQDRSWHIPQGMTMGDRCHLGAFVIQLFYRISPKKPCRRHPHNPSAAFAVILRTEDIILYFLFSST